VIAASRLGGNPAQNQTASLKRRSDNCDHRERAGRVKGAKRRSEPFRASHILPTTLTKSPFTIPGIRCTARQFG